VYLARIWIGLLCVPVCLRSWKKNERSGASKCTTRGPPNCSDPEIPLGTYLGKSRDWGIVCSCAGIARELILSQDALSSEPCTESREGTVGSRGMSSIILRLNRPRNQSARSGVWVPGTVRIGPTGTVPVHNKYSQ
jgi:hypothetical protein